MILLFKVNKDKRRQRDSNPRVLAHTGFMGVPYTPSQRRTGLGNVCNLVKIIIIMEIIKNVLLFIT
jgi:hypothetical protein